MGWRLLLGVLLLLGGIGGVLYGAAVEQEGESWVHPVADLQSLYEYPDAEASKIVAIERHYVVVLPGTDLVVLLRPISEEEYVSYQVRAIAYEIIEWEMLAAAFIEPKLEAWDIAGLGSELESFLKRQVNVISGFAVFSGVFTPWPVIDNGKVVIADVDPKGECVVLRNDSAWQMDLACWSISDGEGSYTFLSGTIVGPGETHQVCINVYNPAGCKYGLYLNDTHDQVYLKNSQGDVVDERSW
jgi:hypothetical protein